MIFHFWKEDSVSPQSASMAVTSLTRIRDSSTVQSGAALDRVWRLLPPLWSMAMVADFDLNVASYNGGLLDFRFACERYGDSVSHFS
ncbi:hypothetical protein Hanom_Chr17g01536141 [Helianthus anomalus]